MNRAVRKFDALLRKGKLAKREEVPHLSGTVKFNDDELQGINEDFRQEFANSDNSAVVIKYLFGYELHYRRHGFSIRVFDKELKRAKEKFREALLA